MLTLYFEGWFQCRFATDPDPIDEPRGISGPTFATPEEPDLENVVRLQNPVALRWPRQDDFGVFVRRVTLGGAEAADHPLISAAVDLLDNARYYQRNLILVTAPFQTPIDPFHLQISGRGITIRRRDLWDVTRPHLTIYDVFTQPALLQRRCNTTMLVQSAEVAEATGALNYAAYRQRRKKDLAALRKKLLKRGEAADSLKILSLDKRIRNIEKDQTMVGTTLAAQQFLGLQAPYQFDLNGQHHIEDNDKRLGGEIGASQNWPLQFWMGGYDVDTMCGYMRGQLSLPFRPHS